MPDDYNTDASCRVTSVNGFAGTVTFDCEAPAGWSCFADKQNEHSIQLSAGGSDFSAVFMKPGPADGDFWIKWIAKSDSIKASYRMLYPVRRSGNCNPPCPNSDGSAFDETKQ